MPLGFVNCVADNTRKGKVCIVEVIYESGTVDDARKIAMSVKAGK